MNKRLMRTAGVIGAVSMFAGCTNAGNVSNVINETIIHEYPEESVIAKENFSPSELSNESFCLSNDVEPEMVERVELRDLTDEQKAALSNASIDLLSEIHAHESGTNILISPYSIDMALGMTENGAEGDTLAQMEETVNGGLSSAEMNTIMNCMTDRLMSADKVSWNVANSLWLKDDGRWKMKDEFLKDVVSFYNPDLYKAPFDDQTVKDINSWVNNETRGMIPEILDYIPDEAIMYLVNAVAFEGEWARKYEDSDIFEHRIFTNIDNTTSEVTMLSSTENGYFTLGKGEGFIKYYEGGDFAFVGILPEEGITPEEYLKDLAASNEDFSKAVREVKYEDVHAQIPEFTMDYKVSLHEIYPDMGMDIPFDEHSADFTGMVEPTSNDPYEVWIGRILHKTHIEVDRKGTKAAAATVVEMDGKCMAIAEPEESHYICLDRPFVYAIVETGTGLPVFIGCQNTFN